jgi:glycosyltransferase involved in cell wall biosynthesis
MKVVYLNPIGAVGGAERSLLDFLTSLRAAEPGCELHLISGAEGPLLAEAARLGVSGEVLPLPPRLVRMGDAAISMGPGVPLKRALGLAWQTFWTGLDARRYAKRLRRRLRELGPDLIHSNGIKSHLLSAMARLVGVPLVWHVHDFLTWRRVVSRLLRWKSRGVAQALANSRAVEADVRALLPGVPATTIYYGIDVDYFAPGPGDGGQLDRLAGLPGGGPGLLRVGLLATYARWKGQDVFLEAARRCASGGAAARFYIVGGPIYNTGGSQFTEAELRALAARLGLDGRVGFIPFQRDTAAVYRALDVVVHASTQPEPFGRTIVEAMACGRAVIAMEAGGAKELFVSGQNALGAPPNDPGALAQAIGALVADDGLRARLGTSARKSAVKQFARDRIGPELLAVYRRLLPKVLSGGGNQP